MLHNSSISRNVQKVRVVKTLEPALKMLHFTSRSWRSQWKCKTGKVFFFFFFFFYFWLVPHELKAVINNFYSNLTAFVSGQHQSEGSSVQSCFTLVSITCPFCRLCILHLCFFFAIVCFCSKVKVRPIGSKSLEDGVICLQPLQTCNQYLLQDDILKQ